MHARLAVRAILAAAAVGLPAAATSADGPVVYKWVDADGIPHFTTHLDRVPAAVRDKVREEANAARGESAPGVAASEPEAPDVAAGPPTPPEAVAPEPEPRESESSPQETRPQAPLGEPATPAAPDAPDAREIATVAPSGASSLDARIATLEQEIERDQTTLEGLLSEERQAGTPLLPDRPEFRQIAHRLPKLQAELARLKEERAQQGTP